MDIKEALAQLDTLDDDLWTQDGAPKTDAVSEIMGTKVSRADILTAAPKFTRENTDLSEIEDQPIEPTEPEPEVETAPADTAVLEAFLAEDPMLQAEFGDKILKSLDPLQLPDLEQLLIAQQTALEEKRTQLEEMTRRTKLNLALTRTWIKALIPDMSNQQAIQEYIRSQQAHRAQKAAVLKEALGGLKPSDLAKLDPRAAIDRAFARRTARGVNRPTR